MIRGGYQINFPLQNGVGLQFGKPIFSSPGTTQPSVPVPGPADLRGGAKLPAKHTLQWDWYFDFASSVKGGPTPFPQMAHKIDTHLSRSVFNIPGGPTPNPLAELNIRRGWRMELPPATEVAHALHIRPLENLAPLEESLWVYILKEASVQHDGERLGAVGSTIVAAVFSGLLRGDAFSYLNRRPHWSPAQELVDGQPLFVKASDERAGSDPDKWEIIDLIRASGLPEAAGDLGPFID